MSRRRLRVVCSSDEDEEPPRPPPLPIFEDIGDNNTDDIEIDLQTVTLNSTNPTPDSNYSTTNRNEMWKSMWRKGHGGVTMEGSIVPTKIRKRGCSSTSSSSSRVRNYWLNKRAILVGKSRAGIGLGRSRSGMPVPTWRTSVESPKHSQGGKSTRPVSARRLAATLWEMGGSSSPEISESNFETAKAQRKKKERVKSGWGLHSGLGYLPHICRILLTARLLQRKWVDSCLRGLQSSVMGFQRMDDTSNAKLCFEQFLHSDMNYCRAGVLPWDVHKLHLFDLKGPFVLQVDEIVNISYPLRRRYHIVESGKGMCLKLSMTDGVQRVFGMEYRPINDLQVFSPAGLKVAIFNVNIRHVLLVVVLVSVQSIFFLIKQLSPNRIDQTNLINSARYPVDASSSIHQYKDSQVFHRLEEHGLSTELPWSKVTSLFNLARLLEQIHNTETTSILYRLILFKGNWNYFAANRNEKRTPQVGSYT